MAENPANHENSYFIMVPFYVRTAITVTQIGALPTPWSAPAVIHYCGHATGKPEERILGITGETPISVLLALEPVSKLELERLHLDRYGTDVSLATGSRPYVEIEAGANPPDFRGRSDGGVRGIDCAQFAVEDRRQAHALFRAVRNAVLTSDLGRFTHLAGLIVYVVVFDKDAGTLELPHKRADTQAIGELVDALAQYRFDPALNPTLQGGQVPDPVSLDIKDTPCGAYFWAARIGPRWPVSSFFFRTGFEIGFVHSTEHRAASAWESLRRLVGHHDQPGIDDLVITVAGPDNMGLMYASEEALFAFMIQEPLGLNLQPRHLKHVVAHSWYSGAVVEFFPEYRQVPGRFGGMVPAHYTVRPPSNAAT